MSNVTPLEIVGIVARHFETTPQALTTRLMGRYKGGAWPLDLKARAVAVRLIRAHTHAGTRQIALLFELEPGNCKQRFDEADARLTRQLAIEQDLADVIAACGAEIDRLHEDRVAEREAADRHLAEREAAHG